jgi:hypothetical protein
VAGRVLEHDTVVVAAERSFAEIGDVDMEALARDLAVSRATLYRITGGRDRLIGDVLWQRGSRSMHGARRQVRGTGADLLIDLARRFNEGVVGDAALRAFLRADPAAAFRVLFMPEGRVHSRFVAAWREVMCEQVEAGHLQPSLPLDELAYLFVRIGESVLYTDLLAGRPPDVRLAETVQRALLTAEPPPRRGDE